MEQLAKELSFYDLLAYFVIGAVTLAMLVSATESFLHRSQHKRPPSFLGVDTKAAAFCFVIVAYILGNLVQATASLTDKWIASRNTIEQHYSESKDSVLKTQLLQQVNDTFHCPPPSQVFNLCQSYCQVKNIDGYIQIMHGRYAFFRGLVIALFIGAVCFVLKSLWDRKPILLWLPACFLLFLVLSINRTIAYNNYFVDHVYRSFYVSTLPVPGAPHDQCKKEY